MEQEAHTCQFYRYVHFYVRRNTMKFCTILALIECKSFIVTDLF